MYIPVNTLQVAKDLLLNPFNTTDRFTGLIMVIIRKRQKLLGVEGGKSLQCAQPTFQGVSRCGLRGRSCDWLCEACHWLLSTVYISSSL